MMTNTGRHPHTSANPRHTARTIVAAMEVAAQFICFPLGQSPAAHQHPAQ